MILKSYGRGFYLASTFYLPSHDMGILLGYYMKQIIEQLQGLGYTVAYTYEPIDQLVHYTVHCEGLLVDMGLADEITFEGKLKEVCESCISCRDGKE